MTRFSMRKNRAHAVPRTNLSAPNRAAFETEALTWIDSLYRTARRLTRVASDAEDLVQDTYLKAFRSRERFEPGTNLKAWLFTILHNTARNRLRDRAREVVTIDSEAVARAVEEPSQTGGPDPITPEAVLLNETMAPELRTAVDALPEVYRQAVWLRDVEEFTYAEIADVLNIPTGTVMSRISRGRRMLFDRLKEQQGLVLSTKS
jgi:RNA polymerase sigma-70 factor (ECF subfamily)